MRRSGRNLGKKPEYTGELVDTFGEELDKTMGQRYVRMHEDHAERVRLANEEAVERCRAALLKQRQELLSMRLMLDIKQDGDAGGDGAGAGNAAVAAAAGGGGGGGQGEGQGGRGEEEKAAVGAGKPAGQSGSGGEADDTTSGKRRSSSRKRVKTEEGAEEEQVASTEEVKPQLVKSEKLGDDAAASFKDAWHKEAVALWGPALQHADHMADWKVFVESRRAKPYAALPSPYALMQERFCSDGWRLLVTCCVISRVSSAECKERCTAAFFALCPTPSSVLAVDPKDVQPCISSLGLFPDRMNTIVEITRAWLNRPVFEVGLDEPQKIRGVGAFAVDSYRLFVMDDAHCQPQDKNLLAYSRWRLSQ